MSKSKIIINGQKMIKIVIKMNKCKIRAKPLTKEDRARQKDKENAKIVFMITKLQFFKIKQRN